MFAVLGARPGRTRRVVLAATAWLSLAAVAGATEGAAVQAKPPAAAPCEQTLSDLYRRVSPAVVLVNVASINPYDLDHRISRGSGSGVIIDPAGLVLTNSHVVFGRQIISVTLANGVGLPAQLVGADPVFDIALLRVPTPTSGQLPTARLGDSDGIEVGEEVYALGNPLGLTQTLTRGIVSALNRLLPGAAFSLTEPLIQTDAAINPGNSGGPLVDRCGDVVGITTAVIPDAQNLGFAVPVNLIAATLPALLKDGRVIRPWFGVQGQFVVPDLKALLRAPLVDGFIVEAVEPGSPADKVGLHDGVFELIIGGQPILLGGDIITEIDGHPITDPASLRDVLGPARVGQRLRVAVFREGETKRFDLEIAERPVLPADIGGERAQRAAVNRASASQGAVGLPRRGTLVF